MQINIFYGVISASVINLELVRGAIRAAQEENAPIIINIVQGQMSKHGDGEIISGIVRTLAARATVPVALNLDHGKDYERITHAFRHQFSSIMIDASEYPLEENIRRTKEVVTLCHSQNVTVEGEIGFIGQAANADEKKLDLFTRVEDAVYFFEATGVDAMAIAVGTVHGKYPSHLAPKIDFDRISQIKQATGKPLVLHGGSDSGEDNIRQAVACGINKINVCTDTFVGCKEGLKTILQETPDVDFMTMMINMETTAKNILQKYIYISGSSGKAANF
ncbi:class II fructose-bisphosphate aldolase [Candidatus Sodalis endolongispinus]|uniref:Class II fructose-bisphosphate aldolase n=1 Tax=Candidatus Sodalis endolongispinus TaxID=2812662 RepID=A0ABS5YAM4_9GAMM|nr:class II fructose-bisphosphate aldolase [Candidatus Sodalis endolongispinus]MBT9431998.1 class II fructose-bisphosphate aldolase [Candidatus Sodalis endolongispinus]